jgi:hypothetical protein
MFFGINKKAFISFIFFCIIVLKDFLIGDLKIIPIRSPTNRMISWFVILPIFIIGLIFSIQFFYNLYFNRIILPRNRRVLNIFFALPILLYIIYVILLLIA